MKNNKGFSLVELIIVIAIMAILVGVMAPQLMKYIEKSNVSSDVQLCDAVRTALVTSLSDPEVFMATDNSVHQIAAVQSGNVQDFTMMGGNTAFVRSMKDILGFSVFQNGDYRDYMRSTPATTNGYFVVQATNGANAYAVWIQHSDMTAQKTDNICNSYTALETSNVIYVK